MSETTAATWRRCKLCGDAVVDVQDHLSTHHTAGEVAEAVSAPMSGEEIAEEVLHDV